MSHVVSGTTATQWAAEDPLPALATPQDQQPRLRLQRRLRDKKKMETRTATKVHQSRTLPATAPDVSTRNQAADQHQGFLVMVFNSETMNTLMLFNLPCLYSNVVKITF
ncbi:hypothetical protein ISCGN_007397 [Ixodes scapularis]